MKDLSNGWFFYNRVILEQVHLVEVPSLCELTVADEVDHILGPRELIGQEFAVLDEIVLPDELL